MIPHHGMYLVGLSLQRARLDRHVEWRCTLRRKLWHVLSGHGKLP